MFLLSQEVKINRSGNAKTSCNNKIINLYLTRKRETLDARLRVRERERERCKFLSLFYKRCECWKLRNQNAWLKNGCTANQTRFYLHKEKIKRVWCWSFCLWIMIWVWEIQLNILNLLMEKLSFWRRILISFSWVQEVSYIVGGKERSSSK